MDYLDPVPDEVQSSKDAGEPGPASPGAVVLLLHCDAVRLMRFRLCNLCLCILRLCILRLCSLGAVVLLLHCDAVRLTR